MKKPKPKLKVGDKIKYMYSSNKWYTKNKVYQIYNIGYASHYNQYIYQFIDDKKCVSWVYDYNLDYAFIKVNNFKDKIKFVKDLL